MDSVPEQLSVKTDSSWILSSGSGARIARHFALFLTCGSGYADLLLCGCGRCTSWQNKSFSWHQTPLEFVLMCINPVSLHLPHVSNEVTLGALDLQRTQSLSVPTWSVPYCRQRLFWRNEIRHSFNHYSKIVSYLPRLLHGRKKGKKIKQVWKDWQCFVEWKLKHF